MREGLSEENYPLFLKWFRDVETIGYLYSAKRIVEFTTIAEVKEFLAEEKDEIFWEIYTGENICIGYTSLCSFQGKRQCEFSIFILDKNYWGRGIGLEVTELMLGHAFDGMNIRKIVLETSEFNKSAIKLYERVGFRAVKIVPQDRTVWHEGKWILSGSVFMEKMGRRSEKA